MKRIISLALLGLTLTGGVAMADRDDRRDRRNDRREFRQDQRQDRRAFRQDMRQDRRAFRQDVRQDRRRWDRGDRRVVRSRPAYRNNTFYFDGGVQRVYRAPSVRYRYRNYYQRPTVLVENYDPMPGYIWISGQWSWNGVEWIWAPGHYDVDASYYDGYGY